MSHSKRFRVFHVTSDGNRAIAVRTGGRGRTGKHSSKSQHRVRITIRHNEAIAKCLECSFKTSPSLRTHLVVFDAEMHGRVTDVVCGQQDERMIISLIRDIRNGGIQQDDL